MDVSASGGAGVSTSAHAREVSARQGLMVDTCHESIELA